MKISVDTHCHTLACAHAYSTIKEIVDVAKAIGLEGVAITDHGPNLSDGVHMWHFHNMKCVPREIDGIKIIRGGEANIIDYDGNIDLDSNALKNLDLVIASLHGPCLPPADIATHTQLWLNVVNNPYVDILGHMGEESYKCDYDVVVQQAAKMGKIIEINNHSFDFRKGANENCPHIASLCQKYGTHIVISSDAHISYQVGVFENALAACEKSGISEDLVLNTSYEKLISFLKKRGVRTY